MDVAHSRNWKEEVFIKTDTSLYFSREQRKWRRACTAKSASPTTMPEKQNKKHLMTFAVVGRVGMVCCSVVPLWSCKLHAIQQQCSSLLGFHKAWSSEKIGDMYKQKGIQFCLHTAFFPHRQDQPYDWIHCLMWPHLKLESEEYYCDTGKLCVFKQISMVSIWLSNRSSSVFLTSDNYSELF